jgi:mono/diheme cytochrome c family protein
VRSVTGKLQRGGISAPSLASEKVGATSAEDLRNVISNGKGHMPKYGGKLSAEEIDTLFQQIKVLNKK